MTDCIYTGAYVHITNYNAHAPADIFRCGESLVLRINPESHWSYTPILAVTHVLTLPSRESQFFWPSNLNDIITAVVPLDACPRTENARPILGDGIDHSWCDGVTDE